MRMTKKKKKGTTTEEPDGEFDHATIENGKLTEEKEKMIKENNKIRKKVSSLTKKQKMQQAMGVIRGLDDWKPWGREAQAKVYYVCTCEHGTKAFFFQCYSGVIVNSRLAAA